MNRLGAPTTPAAPRVAVALGTRPEILKLGPIVRALGPAARLLWSGQHYDPALTGALTTSGFPELSLCLEGVGGASRGQQIARMLTALVESFERDAPDAVVVQGDTNTTNAAAQAAHYTGIPVIHAEAALRSWDLAMPEEVNRLVVAAVGDLHCCATAGNAEHLRRAGVAEDAIRVTGNTIVEATLEAIPPPDARARLLVKYRLRRHAFVLATIHRPENTDNASRLAAILDSLGRLPWPTLLVLHPRTRRMIGEFRLWRHAERLKLIDPVGHAEFLGLALGSRLLVSDSGGIQEEVTVLKKPLVVVRNSTERPEAIEAGFALRTPPSSIRDAVATMAAPDLAARLAVTPSPFGDGKAGQRIAAEALARATGLGSES